VLSSPAVHNPTDHEYNQTEASDLSKIDLDHPSDILENDYEEADDAMKVPPSRDNLKNSKEVQISQSDSSVAQLLSNHRELSRRAHRPHEAKRRRGMA
jgi:hypothetical protein